MKIAYIDRYSGAVYTAKESMIKAWAKNYDGGDPTNCAIWQDQYIAIKVMANNRMTIVAPPYMHGDVLDDMHRLEYFEKNNMFFVG